MNYIKFKVGDIVKSVQGRDFNNLYLITGFDKKGYATLVDGRLRPLNKPKTKNTIHLEFVSDGSEILERTKKPITNCELHKLIENFKNKE